LPFKQKDPLLIYKFEAFNLFNGMLNGVNKEVISVLIQRRFAKALQISKTVEVREKEDYKLSKDEVPNSETANREAGETQQRQVTETIKEICQR
jgi:preprotein translocase subunit SecA